MESQTLIILTIVAAAALYIGRSLWPSRKAQGGCSSCPRNHNRQDDYV